MVPVSNDPVLTAQLFTLPTADPIVLLTCILTLLQDDSPEILSLNPPITVLFPLVDPA